MRLLIATHNRGKLVEYQELLSGLPLDLRTLDDVGIQQDIEETGTTFAENARIKALAYAKQSQLCTLADDSGLEVDALGGSPGVHSARFAGLDSGAAGNSSTAENNAKLLRLLREVPAKRRTARFKCVIALAPVSSIQPATASPVCYADETELQTRLFEGVCEGRIITEPKGRGGFGYDPLFLVPEYGRTLAELPLELKNRISHRGRALRELGNYLHAHDRS